MVRYSDMTRPVGNPLKSESVKDIMSREERRRSPSTTIKYNIYQLIKRSNKPLSINQIQMKLKMMNSRKVFERSVLDLYRSRLINRESCMCGCAFLYSK